MPDRPAWISSVAAAALSVVRRGPRRILWTPDIPMGLGNFLYFWWWAHARQGEGGDARVLVQPRMATWLAGFPAVSELVITRQEVRLTDRRELLWNQTFGVDFTRAELHDFITARLLNAPALSGTPTPTGTIVVNVRRGDYYSNPLFRSRYGFDISAFLRVALREAAHERLGRLHVVSDDIDWCRQQLSWLTEVALEVTYEDPATPPIEQFVRLATARRLVLTNSTFSYWAGYVSNVIHGDASQVWAPWFHARHFGDGGSFHLDPAWHVVRDIPGGWDEAP